MKSSAALSLVLALAALCPMDHASSAENQLQVDRPILHRAGGSDHTYGTTAYWIESAQGLVLIDALMLTSEAEGLAAAMKAKGKPLLGVILTHPHIDHFGGLSTIRRHFPEAPIYASAATTAAVQSVHERAIRLGWVAEFGNDYAPEVQIPDHVLPSEGELVLGDLRLEIRSYGAMEADDNTVIYSDALAAVFPGDAVVSEHVYYLGEGHSNGALEGLERMAVDFPANVLAYPSHGEAAPLHATIRENQKQIGMMRSAVVDALARHPSGGPIDETSRRALIHELSATLADHKSYGLPIQAVIALNVDGLLRSDLLTEQRP